MATRLIEKRFGKVWGRSKLPPMFGLTEAGKEPIGEISFLHPRGDDVALLVKYLFTDANLSIQVHPSGTDAEPSAARRGKDEAWLVLAADPGSKIGVGLRHAVDRDALRRAAVDGTIEDLLHWHPARAGDIFYAPADTIHALGAGLVLIEIQLNGDLTYRLFDYDRERDLHIALATDTANLSAYAGTPKPYRLSDCREILTDKRAFVLERLTGPVDAELSASPERPIWVIPLAGRIVLDGEDLDAASVWLADRPASVSLAKDAIALIAYPGATVVPALLR